MRDLIRREQERSLEIDTIRQALIKGEQRGKPQPFDFDDFLRRMNAENA
jgi:antitoxin ParD1/3/4